LSYWSQSVFQLLWTISPSDQGLPYSF
jgi:hypothetical protein